MDENGQTTEYHYNYTEYKYDALGHMTQTITPNGTTTYERDNLGRITKKKTDPLGNETTYKYDAMGNQITQIDALGHQMTWTYDGLNRQISEKCNYFAGKSTFSTLEYLDF